MANNYGKGEGYELKREENVETAANAVTQHQDDVNVFTFKKYLDILGNMLIPFSC